MDTPPRIPDRHRECLSKVAYPTAFDALVAALRQMQESELCLRVYACRFCAGFHLTSKGARF